MLTDARPRKRNQAEFLKSDRTKALDLPQSGSLPDIAQRLAFAMKLPLFQMFGRVAPNFWRPPQSSIKSRTAESKTTASARKLGYGTLR